MSVFRKQRVIIASLFLPETVVLGEPSTPPPVVRIEPAEPASLPEFAPLPRSTGLAPPLKSIVEDLQDKVRHIRIMTPISFILTAAPICLYGPLFSFAAEQSRNPSPRLPRKYKATYPDASRLRHRSLSRSLSKRSASSNSRRSDDFGDFSSWHIDTNSHCNGGLRNAVDSVEMPLRGPAAPAYKLWVGVLGCNTDSFTPAFRDKIERTLRTHHAAQPVWIPDAEFTSCYDDFCHQVLWPCLHYAIPDAPKTSFYQSRSFAQYLAVNQRFADAIAECYEEGDIVWVNDYHLMLLPKLLRAHPKLGSSAPIGFFMHVAFPSSEIFRCLSVREELLKASLAHLVGFQTSNYARHFRQTVHRILAIEALPKGIQVPEGSLGPNVHGPAFVDVGVYPMGIDVGRLKERKQDPEVAEWINLLQMRYAGMQLIVSRDKLDNIQGVPQKVQAFDMFLQKYPEFQQKVVLLQVALQTSESNELAVAGSVTDVVAHINARYSTLTYQPVIFLHTQDLTFNQYLALLSVADAFIVTSLREGMALRTHEFVECQEGKFGPLILSEFTGSYSYSGFRSCIAINPWDTRGTANAIYQALTMDEAEKKSRWEDLHSHVVAQTSQTFVTSFLNRCVRAHMEHICSDLYDVPIFEPTSLLNRYKHSQARLLFLDFEGTLWQRTVPRRARGATDACPSGEVNILDLLGKLASDSRNEVWLMSGLAVNGVLDLVAERIPGIGIIAENGCFIKTIPTWHSPATWLNMISNFDLTWKSSCLEILNYFTERTPGSFIEERVASCVWRFWTGPPVPEDNPDRQWARRQAAEAQNHIFDSLGERFGLRIIPGANSFLVLPNSVSRSTAVAAILHPGGPVKHHFGASIGAGALGRVMSVLHAVGDDRFEFVLAVSGDEKLLRHIDELYPRASEVLDAAETCSTSGKPTDAKWRLDVGDVLEKLRMFTTVHSQQGRRGSMVRNVRRSFSEME
ncbi:glycosyltransferase family 20 protein [Fistulina hepatica ATCC 64428]|uniref:Glycosyltransferase family 20 protein n=1 Tax=Fistulina hepatica ATCC 64428 TaxID=1128425 RepID=A0A0D7AIN0_9AGAR|nr:glycosyltransferase family 20 protein [Fistulina hepatica ATCC 64428]